MTIKTIKTNEAEAQKIIENKVTFIFRDEREWFREGDILEFRVVRNMKTIVHKIDGQSFIVTAVMNWVDAPIERGYQFIGFRRIT